MKISNPADKRDVAPAADEGQRSAHGRGRGRQTGGRGFGTAADPSAKGRAVERSQPDGQPERRRLRRRQVQRISQAIADGSFQVNAEVIADKLIANAQGTAGQGAALSGMADALHAPPTPASTRRWPPSRIASLRSAKRCAKRDSVAIEQQADALHRTLTTAVDQFAQAAKRGPVSPPCASAWHRRPGGRATRIALARHRGARPRHGRAAAARCGQRLLALR